MVGRALRGAAFGLMLGLAACSSSNSGAAMTAGAESPQTGLERVPLTITVGQNVHRFTVEVAASSEQQEIGLMFRDHLAADGGMIFPFDQAKIASFWMKNTLIPLDMLFVKADGTIDRIAENTIPQSLEPVASGGDVIAVLELAGGTAARLGINESAVVRWQGDHVRR